MINESTTLPQSVTLAGGHRTHLGGAMISPIAARDIPQRACKTSTLTNMHNPERIINPSFSQMKLREGKKVAQVHTAKKHQGNTRETQ